MPQQQQQQPFSRAAHAALLTWVNTFALDRKVERLEDLADGHVFAQMLHDLDPDYDPAELEQNAGVSSSTWLTNKRNVQSVFKALTKYIIQKDSSGAIDFLPRTSDVRSISDNLNAEGLAQLVAVFATAAMLGEHNTRYIPIMRKNLTTGEQAEIMAILQRKDEERQRLAENGLDASLDAAIDPGLVAEAQLATLAADYDRLTKRLADSNTRLEHLQISYELIKDELERKEKELDLERQKHGASESQLIKDLQDKLREQDDLISNQEAQAEDDRQAKQRLGLENAQLLRKAALAEQLQDQVQELKHANDELSKKANTVDRYKQKLEAQRGLETDLQNAMYELGQNKEALQTLDALQKRSQQQQATIERFREMVSGLEQQIEDNRIQRAALEGDVYAAHVQLESYKEQNQLSEARLAELEQQLLQGTGVLAAAGAGPLLSPGGVPLPSNLEEELQHTSDPAAAAAAATANASYAVELARLRAENQVLRNNANVGSENDRLRSDLETARAKEELARKKFTDVFEKYTLLEAQLHAVASGAGAGAGSPLLVDAQQKLAATATELDRHKAASRDLEGQVADRQRELLQLRADLGAVEKGSLEALEELKATDGLVAESYKKELASLRTDFRALQLDNEQQQKQLIEALLSKEELRKTLGSAATAAAVEEEEGVKAAASLNERPLPPPPPASEKTAATVGGAGDEDELRKAIERNEKLRAAMKLLKKQYDTVERDRFELQRKVKALETGRGSGPAAAVTPAYVVAQRAAHDQVVRNLQRENALIATAWYDLTSRLQSNHVVLQRRQDVPKSWLNKQRQMVNGANATKVGASWLVVGVAGRARYLEKWGASSDVGAVAAATAAAVPAVGQAAAVVLVLVLVTLAVVHPGRAPGVQDDGAPRGNVDEPWHEETVVRPG
ncbi:microtubule-binding protein [Niveomyces insectorum RCEF 264]|uniref:Microtubule-binding protein n=1 Tax=Niveomyces insectorum RCEF 264 TaxID=1081102 RepID=A0A167QSV2_9HYPO|nr:microtubule-binding protein [Niveomyces insectorum RCEF 264]